MLTISVSMTTSVPVPMPLSVPVLVAVSASVHLCVPVAVPMAGPMSVPVPMSVPMSVPMLVPVPVPVPMSVPMLVPVPIPVPVFLHSAYILHIRTVFAHLLTLFRLGFLGRHWGGGRQTPRPSPLRFLKTVKDIDMKLTPLIKRHEINLLLLSHLSCAVQQGSKIRFPWQQVN